MENSVESVETLGFFPHFFPGSPQVPSSILFFFPKKRLDTRFMTLFPHFFADVVGFYQ